jgi:protein CpxP
MEPVTKNRSLISIIIILLISNIAILIFFLFLSGDRKSHPRDNKNAISTFLQKDIGFNKQQMDEYQKLREEHIKKARPLFEGIRSAKDSFYNLLYTDTVPDSVVNKAAAVIGEKQMTLDMQMFQHLKKVRTLCTPDELPKFDSLFKKVVERMTGGRFKKQQHTGDK